MNEFSEIRKKEIEQAWKADLSKYPPRPWLKEVSIVAIAWYRYGQSVDNMSDGILKNIHLKIYWLIFHIIEILIGVSIPKSAEIGSGLRIYHFGNIFIHKNAKIGRDCILRQGVTIGNRYNDDMAPIIGNNVELGAYAQVLGNVHIEDNVKIGAMSVVLKDVLANKTVCGNPARVISSTNTLSS